MVLPNKSCTEHPSWTVSTGNTASSSCSWTFFFLDCWFCSFLPGSAKTQFLATIPRVEMSKSDLRFKGNHQPVSEFNPQKQSNNKNTSFLGVICKTASKAARNCLYSMAFVESHLLSFLDLAPWFVGTGAGSCGRLRCVHPGAPKRNQGMKNLAGVSGWSLSSA